MLFTPTNVLIIKNNLILTKQLEFNIFNKNIDTLIVERVIIDEKACSYLV